MPKQPHKCLKCLYTWLSRVARPKECPQCKSRYWQARKPSL